MCFPLEVQFASDEQMEARIPVAIVEPCALSMPSGSWLTRRKEWAIAERL
jgi:hypothetical protein